MFLFVSLLLIVGVLGLDISAAVTVDFQVEIGTSTSLQNPNSKPDY